MNYPDTSYFLLFANCIPVKGAKRSILYDIQRNNFEFIPNELYTILTKHLKKTSGEIKELFNREYDDILEEYFDFLIQKEFVVNVSKLDSGFTKYDTVYDVPNAITNCIIDFDTSSRHPLTKIREQLDALICQSLQLRFYCPVSIDQLEAYLSPFDDSKLRSIELLLPFSEHFSEEAMEQLGRKFPRLQYMIIYSATENKTAYVKNNELKISYASSAITSESCCGNIHSMFFRTNIQAYQEAKHFNSCLNKKISIDKKGAIRNCPSMKNRYGHIDDHSLQTAVSHPEFKSSWGITKDKINSCKVCEFRYMCSDCRAYVENPEDLYSKPLKCGYDPYTNKWDEWSTHPLKQDAINYYGIGKEPANNFTDVNMDPV
jgi:SPASM domain peptide maturase of grasp-with-spasm system